MPIQLRAALGPVRLGDLADFGGVVVPTATKEAWLAAIEARESQSGSAGLDISALDLTGLDFDAFAMTPAAVSWAFPLGALKIGATGKYMVRHGLAVGRSTSGAISSDPLRLTLSTPIVATCDDEVVYGQFTFWLWNR